MVSETRAQAQGVETNIKKTEAQVIELQEHARKTDEELQGLNSRLDSVMHVLAALTIKIDGLKPLNSDDGGGTFGNDRAEKSEARALRMMHIVGDDTIRSDRSWFQARAPKPDFPYFDGSKAREWINTSRQYFELCPMPDDVNVIYVTLHLQGKAKSWFNAYKANHHTVKWSQFCDDVINRFKEDAYDNVIGDLTKLHQDGTVEEYQVRFEELLPLVQIQNPQLIELFLKEMCVSGLKKELQGLVKLFKPTTMEQVFSIAKIHESNLDLQRRSRAYIGKSGDTYTGGNKLPPLLSTPPLNRRGDSTQNLATVNMNPNKKPTSLPMKYISNEEMQKRRDLNLCYYCDEKYMPGHKWL